MDSSLWRQSILGQIQGSVILTHASMERIRLNEKLIFCTKDIAWSISQIWLHFNRVLEIL